MSLLRQAKPSLSQPVMQALRAEAIADGGRAAPEPLTVILPALATLGAVASVAAVAWIAQDRSNDRQRVKRRVDVILRDLETSCTGILELLRRIKRQAHLFGLDGPTGTAPLKFGLHAGRVDGSAGQVYAQLANDAATMLVLATQNSFELIAAIEDGEIDAPDEIFHNFASAQERLNGLLANRAPLRQMVNDGIEISAALAACVSSLKQFKNG